MTLALGRCVVGLALLVLSLASCAEKSSAPAPPGSGAAPQRSVAPAIAPEWQLGDRWVYDWTSGADSGSKTVEVAELREVNNVQYYVVRLGDAEHYYTRALHWAAAIRDGRVEARMVPPQPWFMWPLVPGEHWVHQGRFEQRDNVATFNDRFTAVGVESVDVPAGRYDALKVVRETDRRDSDEYWYASDVRWYVRWLGRRGDSQFEERLREYRPASRPR